MEISSFFNTFSCTSLVLVCLKEQSHYHIFKLFYLDFSKLLNTWESDATIAMIRVTRWQRDHLLDLKNRTKILL